MLVVDDDQTVAEIVSRYLVGGGHEVVLAHDGLSAIELALGTSTRAPADLVVLDVMLPGLDGIEVCRRLRLASDVPVVMLTALGAEVDRVLGLEVGADDYVAKPFSTRELVLRVASVLRRRTSAMAGPRSRDLDSPPERLVSGPVVVDPAARTVRRDGVPLHLTLRESDLLLHLLRHPGRAFSREDLLSQVWGWDFGDHSTVTVHVRRLRNKVEADPGRPALLVTVRGVGYRWDAPVTSGPGWGTG